MLKISIKEDGVLRRVGVNASKAGAWLPKIVRDEFKILGGMVVGHMRLAVSRNRYKGDLESSIRAEYDVTTMTLRVSPTVKRKRWDGGLILELGTKPIPNIPFAPIKEWANFKGIPAFPVWYKIRTKGVAAHPFLARTMQAARGDIDTAAQKIADESAKKIIG